jgi:hypothetical protein
MKSKKRAADIAQSSGTIITFKINYSALHRTQRRKCTKQNHLISTNRCNGAGHDSQRHGFDGAPIGMIFVPSVAGISHFKEFSKAVDINGANVLLQTILALDMD